MDVYKKYLKETADMVLFLTVLSLIHLIGTTVLYFLDGFDPAKYTDGTTEGIWMAGIIVVAVLGLASLIPQTYVGMKGRKMAAQPDGSKAHIVWAIILLVFSVAGLIEPIKALIVGGSDTLDLVLKIVLNGIEASVFGTYVYLAGKVRTAA